MVLLLLKASLISSAEIGPVEWNEHYVCFQTCGQLLCRKFTMLYFLPDNFIAASVTFSVLVSSKL